MKFHYAGKFNGDTNSLPQRELAEGTVPFKEPENPKKLAIIANIGSIIVMIALGVLVAAIAVSVPSIEGWTITFGCCLPILTLYPHEMLHALCFKEDVYMYTNLKQGMMFVVGPEDMTKTRFILMSLCPNVVFGVIPFILFLIFPQVIGLGIFGTICIGMGFGDYINVFNAITQMPNNALTYLSGFNSYWYIPKGGK